jgi:YidC/Oxa1 family membrane protein insertase
MGFLGVPLGFIMRLIYQVIDNYGWSLVIFTVLVRLLLLPLNIKQQKSSAKMAIFQPKLQALQKKYGKDKERYQQEMMKLYEEEGYNPMSSCLPMLIQMLVLFGIIDVVYKPLRYMLSIPSELIKDATAALTDAGMKVSSNAELVITNIIQGNNTDYSPDLFANIFSAEQMELIRNFDIKFLGVNLGEVPTFTWPILLIPILSGVTSLLVSIFSMRQQKKNGMMDGQAAAGMGMMKGMMYIMPIFSTWIAFSLPTGVAFYWIISNILSFVQSIFLYTFYSPEKVRAKVEEEMKTKKKKPSRYQQAVAKAREQQAIASGKPLPKKESDQDDGKELSANQRIALARKRMAEKYGDDYDEK